MSGWILLAIGLGSLAVIFGAFAYLGLRAWRLFKRGMRLSRTAAPMAAELASRADTLTAMADELGRNGEQITVNLERLQQTALRLQVLLEAWGEALAPYRRARAFFGR